LPPFWFQHALASLLSNIFFEINDRGFTPNCGKNSILISPWDLSHEEK